MTIRKAAAITTSMAINGGLKSNGSFEGGEDWCGGAVAMGIVLLIVVVTIGDGEGDEGEGEGDGGHAWKKLFAGDGDGVSLIVMAVGYEFMIGDMEVSVIMYIVF